MAILKWKLSRCYR
uniref:E8 n=1 Tax=Human papillomavirus type 16 TaxID=333760 RepID=A0A7D7CZJ5_HPV16|nr:E8 [Human papillomavirus 16]QMJ53580.1 E8 [Human papillomavirus 16]QMJ53588.1 E8 [Human papillomavirus 16]QMJ53597.1 E8 [Human papillomavirus 16]QMJ53606.1 E8 [Human papillomavirus 16]